MSVLRTFILRRPEIAASLVDFLKKHAGPAATDGKPLQVVIARHSPKRKDAHNAFMWAAVLQPIAEQACVAGRYFSAEVWHEQMKRDFLPELCAKGVEKWRWLPDGSRELAMSTTDLNSEEMSLYLEKVQAHAATELGVEFDAAA